MVYIIPYPLYSSPTASSLFISLSSAALFSSPLQRLNSSLASFCQSLPTPLLGFFHSDVARLPPPIAPHPEVELIEPASVASPHAGICSSSSPVAEAVGQGGMCVAADIARHQRHTSQHIFCSANIQAGQVSAAGSVEEHWHSAALHERVGRQFDGFKGAEENKRQLSVPCFSLKLTNGSNSTVEEQLWQTIPQKAFAAEIHVCFDIELVSFPWTIPIRGHQADAVLPMRGKDQIPILIYIITYTVVYHMIYIIIYIYDIYDDIYNGINSVIHTWGFCPRKRCPGKSNG